MEPANPDSLNCRLRNYLDERTPPQMLAYSVKRIGFSVQSVPQLYETQLIMPGLCESSANGRQPYESGRPMSASSSPLFIPILLTIVQQGRGLEIWSHCAQQPKDTLPCLPEIHQKPLSMQVPPYFRYTVSTLERSHCTQ